MNKQILHEILKADYNERQNNLDNESGVNPYNAGFLVGYTDVMIALWLSNDMSMEFDVAAIEDFQNRVNKYLGDCEKYRNDSNAQIRVFDAGRVRGINAACGIVDSILNEGKNA